MTTATDYLYIGIIILAASESVAIYHNFQGVRCRTAITQFDGSVVARALVGELEKSCSVITNSYAYSLYAGVAGVVLTIAGLMKKRRTSTF